jgi:GNAT superfamily N-acetyltransferase
MEKLAVERVRNLPGVDDLVDESGAQGFALVRRLVEDWQSNVNRFDRPGEILLAARLADRVVGVCGLNIDPYAANPAVGRVRHLYVSTEHRRKGIGRELVGRVVAEARKSFKTLTLRTNTPDAAAFYEVLGFRPTDSHPQSTHFLDL